MGNAPSTARRVVMAAQLVAKQKERTKLLSTTLPASYYALGKHHYDTAAFGEEYTKHHQAIARLFHELHVLEQGKPAAVAVDQHQTLKMKVADALAELGRVVFEKHRDQSSPQELFQPIAEAHGRVWTLDTEIKKLSAPEPHLRRPKFAMLGVAFVGVLVAVVLVVFVGQGIGRGNATSQGSSVVSDHHNRVVPSESRPVPRVHRERQDYWSGDQNRKANRDSELIIPSTEERSQDLPLSGHTTSLR